MDYLQEQGLQGDREPSLHIRTPWRNDRKEVVMWLTGLPYHKIDEDSFQKAARSLACFIIGASAGVEVRTPTPDEQREYEIHASWIVKTAHPALKFNSLPNFLLSSLRVSKKYSSIDAERQLDVSFSLNKPECIEEGGSENVIRIAERVDRGDGYKLVRDLVKGCPDVDVFYRSYEGSGLWQKLSENKKVLV